MSSAALAGDIGGRQHREMLVWFADPLLIANRHLATLGHSKSSERQWPR